MEFFNHSKTGCSDVWYSDPHRSLYCLTMCIIEAFDDKVTLSFIIFLGEVLSPHMMLPSTSTSVVNQGCRFEKKVFLYSKTQDDSHHDDNLQALTSL